MGDRKGARMELKTFAALAVQRMRQWPPEYPPRGSLLTGVTVFAKPRDDWTANDWRDYALFLERRGSDLRVELDRAEAQLANARSRLKRGAHIGSLLWWKDKPGKGRPKGCRNESFRIAEECVRIAEEFGLEDSAALRLWCVQNGYREQRADAPASRGGFAHIVPRMRTVRAEQKK
jgi:hypothetical protein